MAARTLLWRLPILMVTVYGAIIFITGLILPAQAAQPSISITITPNVIVNTDYNIVVTLSDTTNGSTSKAISLSVASPGSTITSSVTTNGSSMASATLHTGTVAGYNNITAKYAGMTFTIPVTVNPGPPAMLNMIATPSFRLANGMSTATASASVFDQFHNPIGGAVVNFTIDGAPGTAMTDSSGTANYAVGPYGSVHTANITANINALNQAATVRFLDRNNLFLDRYPASSLPIESPAEVKATFYADLGNHTPDGDDNFGE